jgi:pimeloyl-ACP methyl ester carboxylesterase
MHLTDALGFSRFAIVGHSMSSLVALHLAQEHPDRVTRAVAITPPPPTGFGATDAMLEGARALALGDEAMQLAVLKQRFGQRLSPGFTAYKAMRFRATSDAIAASSYVAMFARDGLPDPTRRIARVRLGYASIKSPINGRTASVAMIAMRRIVCRRGRR